MILICFSLLIIACVLLVVTLVLFQWKNHLVKRINTLSDRISKLEFHLIEKNYGSPRINETEQIQSGEDSHE